jgi:hypothetical protein
MSLHLSYNVKEPSNIQRGQSPYPAIAIGEQSIRSMLATVPSAVCVDSTPSGKRAYMEDVPARQTVFSPSRLLWKKRLYSGSVGRTYRPHPSKAYRGSAARNALAAIRRRSEMIPMEVAAFRNPCRVQASEKVNIERVKGISTWTTRSSARRRAQ